jgi:hypothetical protein
MPMWAPLARSTVAVGRIGLRRRIASQPARVRAPAEEHEAGKPHHARSVSMSRSTCIASARSASSAASSSASARTAAAAFRRAASMSAARTAADTGVPSLVKTASAREASSSGRKVIVSATESSVIQNVRRCVPAAALTSLLAAPVADGTRWLSDPTTSRCRMPVAAARRPAGGRR